MTALPRLRRHTDGRVALCFEPGLRWHILSLDSPEFHCSVPNECEPRDESGWTELFVTELPEPNAKGAWCLPCGDGVLTATADGIALDALPWPGDVEELRVEALSMLAALAACERYRAEREAMT